MKERIAAFVREEAYRPLAAAELAEALALAPEKVLKVLEEMEREGLVVRTRTGRYGAPERMNLAVGRLQVSPKGFAFLDPDDPGSADIYVSKENLHSAMHGDRVVVRITPPGRRGGRPEGEVIRILERANERIVGTFHAVRWAGFVTPDDRRLTDDIVVPKGAQKGAEDGEKVVVQVFKWPDLQRPAEGKVIERLGRPDDPGVDILSIIRRHDLPEAFPPKVLAEAAAIPAEIDPDEIGRREDLRGLTIISIDPDDAKDLDDAISLERAGGVWRLGVHIADVSFYVRENSALDKEARRRGTSVYMADRVVPMLPPRLSEDICSLNPRVDRLTFSCLMDIEDDGGVVDYRITPSIIRTAERMTYGQVQAILDGDPAALERYAHIVKLCRQAEELMRILRARRERRGSLDFDLPEAKVVLDERGFPLLIRKKERTVADQIIEECMLAANETVAEHCARLEVPFIYRIHEEPAADKLKTLSEFLSLFRYQMKLPRGRVKPSLIQQAIAWFEGKREEGLVNTVILRSMKQARYHHENFGHFGLGADFYTHFTSPIRRYPDLVVHRVLRALAQGGLTGRTRARWEKLMPDIAVHSSQRERAADEAERESLDLKKAQFMQDKVGDVFPGLIAGVTPFGFFVQLENTVEGLVHVSTLTDDYYRYDEKQYALMGERTRKMYRLGDPVTVRVNRVDVEARQVDFLLDDDSQVSRQARGAAPSRKKQAVRKRPPRPGQGKRQAKRR